MVEWEKDMRWKKETQMQSWFTRWGGQPDGQKWIQSHGGNIAYECKLVRAKDSTLADSKVPEHQVASLLRAAGIWTGGLRHKISDSGIGFKPCDGFIISSGYGALIIGFENGRIFDVDIEDYDMERGDRIRGSVNTEWIEENGREIK